MLKSPATTIVSAFDAAAMHYDEAAPVQRQVARELVQMVEAEPSTILDIGCGTGHVAAQALARWPKAVLTAMDASPAMLRRAQEKTPALNVLQGDALSLEGTGPFDLILSSMLLHWLPDPLSALRVWQKHLNPGGRLYAALPVAGTLEAWRQLCKAARVEDGLWDFPKEDFAKSAARVLECRTHEVSYDSLRVFLENLKRAGAATPRAGHRPFSVSLMRRLLRQNPGPFRAEYRVLYLVLQA